MIIYLSILNKINLFNNYKVLDNGLNMFDHYSFSVNVSCGGVHDPSNEKVGHEGIWFMTLWLLMWSRICWIPENKSIYSEAANAALAKIEIPDCSTACCDTCSAWWT